ncbi:MAG: hypothetical protein IPJ82_21175 [Lewinellaceae bacterium]|nr:hypothetical protein [Lewinellaceae bacterium]
MNSIPCYLAVSQSIGSPEANQLLFIIVSLFHLFINLFYDLTPHASRLTPHASRLTPHVTPHAFSRLTPHSTSFVMMLLIWPTFSFTQTLIYGKPVILSEDDQSLVDQEVVYNSAFNFHPLALWSDLNYEANEEVEFSLDVGDDTITLNLQKSMLYPEGARMMIRGDSTPLLIDLKNEGIYRGYVDGDTNQMAGFIIRKNHFFGYYEKDGNTWFISDIRKLVEDPQSDPVTTYIKYRDIRYTDFTCGTPDPATPDPPEDPTTTDRVNGEFHFEMAYDVDFELFSIYPSPSQSGDPTREEQIEKDLADITMNVEGFYRQIVSGIQFHIVDINIWTSSSANLIVAAILQTIGRKGKIGGRAINLVFNAMLLPFCQADH